MASVLALYSDAYDIKQIMELYNFPDEDEIPDTSFYYLYQYLTHRPQLEEKGSSLSIFANAA